jgi:F-type H+-transporting ATPase subunit a
VKRGLVAAWLVLGLVALAALAFIPGGHKTEFSVAEEFELQPLIELPSIGPVDLSITKAVVYLWIAAAALIVIAIVVSRTLKPIPSRFQYAVETLYGLAREGIVGSVMKSGQATWFPYIAGAFFFVLTSNLLGLIPLPFAEHHQFGFYAATANLYVTLALALCTFLFTHYAGIRKNGFVRYFRNWAPPSAPPVLRQLILVIHAVSEAFRLVSLSVRLFANMLAGHAILGVFFAMALIFQSYLAAAALQMGSVLIYLFEIFVAFIQAFIFAILSAVYIGGALDQEH